MAKKTTKKKPVSKITTKGTVSRRKKIEIIIGSSSNFSIEEAIKDALTKATELDTDYYKYEIIKIEYETGGIAQVSNLIVTMKRISPK